MLPWSVRMYAPTATSAIRKNEVEKTSRKRGCKPRRGRDMLASRCFFVCCVGAKKDERESETDRERERENRRGETRRPEGENDIVISEKSGNTDKNEIIVGWGWWFLFNHWLRVQNILCRRKIQTLVNKFSLTERRYLLWISYDF